jgi:hypothetical protein
MSALATREMSRCRRQANTQPESRIAFAPDDRLWLFYSEVARVRLAVINVIMSEDQGFTWSALPSLITPPFINIGTLRSVWPIRMVGLPVYHEFLCKFPEYLYLDGNGRAGG